MLFFRIMLIIGVIMVLGGSILNILFRYAFFIHLLFRKKIFSHGMKNKIVTLGLVLTFLGIFIVGLAMFAIYIINYDPVLA